MVNIRDVAERINELAARFKMDDFQYVRKDIKKKKRPGSRKIFSKKSIFETYAYHSGGSTEIQYNIGYGKDGEFRYGLAFSLETRRSMYDISIFEPKVERFNEFVTRNPHKFSGMWLWYCIDDDSEYEEVKSIDWSSVQSGTFIFVGKFLDKELVQLTAQDYEEVLGTFDELLDVYRYVESDSTVENISDFRLPEEVSGVDVFREGFVRQVSVNAYERSQEARQRCIAYYGTNCSICGFSFAQVYGQVGDGFIHVHHLKSLSEVSDVYEVDPIRDLRPVCPNCHAIIHRRKPPYSIEEIKDFLLQASQPED